MMWGLHIRSITSTLSNPFERSCDACSDSPFDPRSPSELQQTGNTFKCCCSQNAPISPGSAFDTVVSFLANNPQCVGVNMHVGCVHKATHYNFQLWVQAFYNPGKNAQRGDTGGSNRPSKATHQLFFFSASVPSQTWQLSELKDRRANNYLSQVVAVIVGGWRMIEQSCVCMCVFETACPFDLVLIQTHRETVLCPQTRGLLSPEQAQPITPSKPLQWRQRAAEQDEWLGPGWKPLYQEEEGWRVCLVVGGENISKFRCRIQADFFFFEQTRLSSSFFLFCGLALCWWCYQSNPNSADMFLVHGVLQGGWVWLNDIPLCLQICEQVQTWLQAQRDSTDRFGIAGKQLVSPHYLTSNQILAASADFFSFGVCYMQWKCVNIATAIIETDFESASIMSRGHWHVRDAYLQTQTSTLVWRLCLAERWISRQ